MSRVDQLAAHFEGVASTMAELPIYNAALSVAVTDFEAHGEAQIGVLVTPWCMNLVILPSPEAVNTPRLVGVKTMEALPSGQYEFIWGELEGLGFYQSCSLFSPMFEFESQAVALDTANEVMKALFLTEHQEAAEWTRAKAEQASSASAEPNPTSAPKVKSSDEQAEAKDTTPETLSRRGFLTGRFVSGAKE